MASYHDCQIKSVLDKTLAELRQMEASAFTAACNSHSGVVAAQLRLLLERIARGIPPGRTSLENLVGLLASAADLYVDIARG